MDFTLSATVYFAGDERDGGDGTDGNAILYSVNITTTSNTELQRMGSVTDYAVEK